MTVGGQYVGGGVVTVFWSSNCVVYGIDIGVSFGAGADWAVGKSDTSVHHITGLLGDLAEAAWKVADHEKTSPAQALALARKIIQEVGRHGHRA